MTGTGFSQDTSVDFGPLTKVENLSYVGTNELKATLRVYRNTGLGHRDVIAKNPDGETAVLKDGLEIKSESKSDTAS